MTIPKHTLDYIERRFQAELEQNHAIEETRGHALHLQAYTSGVHPRPVLECRFDHGSRVARGSDPKRTIALDINGSRTTGLYRAVHSTSKASKERVQDRARHAENSIQQTRSLLNAENQDIRQAKHDLKILENLYSKLSGKDRKQLRPRIHRIKLFLSSVCNNVNTGNAQYVRNKQENDNNGKTDK